MRTGVQVCCHCTLHVWLSPRDRTSLLGCVLVRLWESSHLWLGTSPISTCRAAVTVQVFFPHRCSRLQRTQHLHGGCYYHRPGGTKVHARCSKTHRCGAAVLKRKVSFLFYLSHFSEYASVDITHEARTNTKRHAETKSNSSDCEHKYLSHSVSECWDVQIVLKWHLLSMIWRLVGWTGLLTLMLPFFQKKTNGQIYQGFISTWIVDYKHDWPCCLREQLLCSNIQHFILLLPTCKGSSCYWSDLQLWGERWIQKGGLSFSYFTVVDGLDDVIGSRNYQSTHCRVQCDHSASLQI